MCIRDRDLEGLLAGPVATLGSSVRSRLHLAVHVCMERLPVRCVAHLPIELAGHGGSEQHGGEPDHRMERPDGWLVPGRGSDAADLYLPRPLLPEGHDDGGAQGVGPFRYLSLIHISEP